VRGRRTQSARCIGLLLALVGSFPIPAARATHEPLESAGIAVRIADVRPDVLAPGARATAHVRVENRSAEAIRIEALRLFLLDPEGTAPREVASLEADADSEAALEAVAPHAHRLLAIPFRVPPRMVSADGRRYSLVAVVRARSARDSHTLFSAAREVSVARLRMRDLTVSPTVLPDCVGATSVWFELDILNATFDPVDDAELQYELRERDTLVASGRLRLGRIAPGERRRVRPLEPIEVPASALIAGQRLVLELRLHPEGLIERRWLAIGTGADVKVEDIAIAPAGGAPGDPVLPGERATLSFTLVNRGNQMGTSPMLTVRVSAEVNGRAARVEPERISLPNVALAPCGGSVRIGGAHSADDISAGASPFVLFIPEDAEEGEAVVRVVVDRVAEETTTDTDEEPPRASFQIDLPNLRPLDISAAQDILIGQSASVRFRVANVRDHPWDRAPVPAGVRVRAELWQNGRQLAHGEFRTRRQLGAGQSEFPPADFALPVPAQAEEGAALIRLEVDPPTPDRPRGEVRESEETDNTASIPVRLIAPLPDLVVEGARVLAPGDPPTVIRGAPTPLFFLIANRGEGTADRATHEISLAITIALGPIPLQLRAPLHTVETPRLRRNQFVPFLTTITIPPVVQLPGLLFPVPILPGPAEILITADSKKVVPERDEENNTTRLPVTVVVPP